MSDETRLLRILGVGSPFIGDSLGLQAIALLQQETRLRTLPFRQELLALDRPGSGLIDDMAGADVVVLIDAMVSGENPATVKRIHPDELILRSGIPSSHSLGVAESLALARVLGALPPQLFIYGIEAGKEIEPEDWYPKLRLLLQQDLGA